MLTSVVVIAEEEIKNFGGEGVIYTIPTIGKYGILPEMLRHRDLPAANGLIQLTTFLAIIFGVIAAGSFHERLANELWIAGLVCVCIAVLGTGTSLLIRKTPVA